MSNQRGVGKFCSIVVLNDTVGSSDSIISLDGSKLGEGAEAFCSSTGQAYRWTSNAITALGPTFITPLTGGGTWVMQAYTQFLACFAFGSAAFTGAAAQATTGIGLWTALKAGAAFYTTGPGFTNSSVQLVTINSAAGFMTLANSMGSFRAVPLLVTMQLATVTTQRVAQEFSVQASEVNSLWEFDLTPSPGGNVGLNVQSQTATQVTLLGSGINSSVSVTRLFIPTANVAYYPVFRCLTSGTATLFTPFYQMAVVSAGSST